MMLWLIDSHLVETGIYNRRLKMFLDTSTWREDYWLCGVQINGRDQSTALYPQFINEYHVQEPKQYRNYGVASQSRRVKGVVWIG